MALRNFLYRQRQRAKYHLTRDQTIKRIAEINQYRNRVSVQPDGFLIRDNGFLLPKAGFEFLFQPQVFELFLGVPKAVNGKYRLVNDRLFLEFDELKLEITSRSELYIIDEIFVDKCYQFLLPQNEVVHVIDIGMNVGLASLFFAALPFVRKVHAYEPFKPTFLQAQKNFGNNAKWAAKIEPNNFGLGLREGKILASYDPANNGNNSSLGRRSKAGGPNVETLEIRSAYDVVRSLLDSYPTEEFILKIDTEGAEYLIFESLFRQKLSGQVKGVMVEWHFEGCELLENLLLSNGFTLTSFRLNTNSGLIYAFR